MALFDQTTQTKHCDKCNTTFKGQEVHNNFFKLQSTKDGFARVCKKCYYVRAAPKPETSTPAKAQGVAASAAERKVVKAYSHSDADIKAAEQSSGLKFQRWMDMGDHYAPVFGKGQE